MVITLLDTGALYGNVTQNYLRFGPPERQSGEFFDKYYKKASWFKINWNWKLGVFRRNCVIL